MATLIADKVSEESLAICAGVFLLLAVVAGTLIAPYNRLAGRGKARLPISSLSQKPILQIELARQDLDLVDILAPGDTKRNLHDARVGNDLDTFFFIPAYTGLLLSVGLLLLRSDQRWQKLKLVGAVAVPVAAVCDWLENAGITATLDHFGSNGAPLPGDAMHISRPSLVKWTLLSIILSIYGICALRNLIPWRWARLGMAAIGVGGTLLGAWIAVMLTRYALAMNGP
jgi:hypothetical protein